MARQWFDIRHLQGSTTGGPATANGNGFVVEAAGVDSAQQVEIVESNGGTCTINLEGSIDATNGPWYAVGYQQVDNVLAPTRAVAAIAVIANSSHIYQVLDPYPNLRARLTALAGGAQVTAKVYLIGA